MHDLPCCLYNPNKTVFLPICVSKIQGFSHTFSKPLFSLFRLKVMIQITFLEQKQIWLGEISMKFKDFTRQFSTCSSFKKLQTFSLFSQTSSSFSILSPGPENLVYRFSYVYKNSRLYTNPVQTISSFSTTI